MGKGDKKSKRGKIFMGSFGISRPRNKKADVVVNTAKPVVKKEKKVIEVAPEVVEAVVKPAKKPAVKKPKKETKETEE